jgi:hypothetical protein
MKWRMSYAMEILLNNYIATIFARAIGGVLQKIQLQRIMRLSVAT